MKIRNWLEETHASGIELVRHFLGCSFDSEMFGGQGEWQKDIFGSAGASGRILSSIADISYVI